MIIGLLALLPLYMIWFNLRDIDRTLDKLANVIDETGTELMIYSHNKENEK